tara:strand:- start:2422 stop:2691 length:270 start_codon:yes stop_codon:yes gene_type:complete
LIEDTLKDFKKKVSKLGYKIESIYFEFTDLDKIYSLSDCNKIEKIDKEKYLKFKMSTDDLFKIVNAEIHPEDLMFDKKIKISGDISIIS